MSISEDKSYIDIYRIGCYLDSICYYYKILEITGSKDRLSKFQIPLNGYYMLKMREIFYKEFLDFLEDYNKMSISSSILASNSPKKLLDSSSNTNDIMLKYIQEESLVEPIYQNKYSNNEYSYVEHGRYVEDCSTDKEESYVEHGRYVEDCSTDKEESYVEHGRYVEDCVIGNKEGYDGSSIIYEESPYDDIVYEDEECENNENTEEDLSDLLNDEWDDEEDLSDLLNQDYSDEETSDDLYDEFSDEDDLSYLLSQEYSEEEEDSDDEEDEFGDEEDLSELLNEDYEDEDSGELYDEFSDEEDLSELLNEDYEDEFSDEEDLSDLLNDEDDEFNDEEDLSDLLSDEDDLSYLLNEEDLSDSSVNGTSTTDKVLNYTNNIGNTAKQTNVRVIPKKDLTDSIYDITGKVLTTGKKAIINGIRKLDN